MKIIYLTIIIILLNLNCLSAKEIVTTDANLLFNYDNTQTSRFLNINNSLLINLKTIELDRIFSSNPDEITISNFPVSVKKYQKIIINKLEQPFDNETQFITSSSGGMVSFPAPKIALYSGIIEDDLDSKILLSYSNHVLYCTISNSDGLSYSINPDIGYNNIDCTHILKSVTPDNPNEIPFICQTPDYTTHSSEAEDNFKNNADKPLSPSKLYEVKVACEATSEFFNMFQDLDKITSYMTSVIAHTSKIYQDNFNTRLIISYVLIWQNPQLDPYLSSNLLSDKLYVMPDLWRNKNVDRAITVLFASLAAQQGGVSVAGIAMGGEPGKGNLCNTNQGYCVIGVYGSYNYPTAGYTWDVNVAAHEIGHLFGSPHTFSCYYAPNMIDTCVTQSANGVYDACISNGNPIPNPGTIMSYCHLTNSTHSVQLVFHPREIGNLRKATERAACAKVVSGPFISLLSPLGSTVYPAGSDIKIRWTAAGVSQINLKYSTNYGANWISIANNINVNDSVYIWNAGNVNSESVKVLIHSSSDMTINDSSLVKFAVLQQYLKTISPNEGDKFAQLSKLTIKWQSLFVDSLKIEFSSDNGSSWGLIATLSNNIETFDYQLPQIESDKCLIRMTSLDKNKLISMSGKFGVGIPKATIIAPSPNEKLCIGEIYNIKWSSDYLATLNLEYSTDNGVSWKKVSPVTIDAKLQSYNWKVPDKKSDSVLLRIFTKITENVILDIIQHPFQISPCEQSVADDKNKNFINSLSVSPNPVIFDMTLNFHSEYEFFSNSSILLIDNLGNHKILKNNIIINKGENQIKFNLKNFVHGSYTLVLMSNDKAISIPLQIIR